MKIGIFTMGTRGDVQPYIYLARALIQNGHTVVIGTHPCWRELVEKSAVAFAPIGPDVNIEHEAAVIRGKTSNAALSLLKTMNFVFRIIQNSSKEIYDACIGKDLIIVSHAQMGSTEAEALGIPTIHVTLQTEMLPEKLKKQTLAGKMIGYLVGGQVAKPYNKIRKIYGLPKLKPTDDMISSKLNLIPVSQYVKQRSPYWEDRHILTGYWYEEDKDYTPPSELVEFLNKGDKPIILALGAMSFESDSEKDKLDMFVNAFAKTGKRAIIQGFQKTLQNYTLPDTMLACGSVPHSWLFRQGYAVIHHCGFGTASAAMIYGIPSIPVPHVLDQMGFAKQLEALRVSTKLISSRKLSESSITEAICELDANYDELYNNVQKLSIQLQNEKGLEKAVQLIEQQYERVCS